MLARCPVSCHGRFVLLLAGQSTPKNTAAQPEGASDNFGMTEDEHLRGLITGFAAPLVGLLWARFQRKRPADRPKQWRRIANRLGYRLGALWARRHRRTKQ